MIKDLSRTRKKRARRRMQGRLVLKKPILGVIGFVLFLGLFLFLFLFAFLPARDLLSSIRQVQAHQKTIKDSILLNNLGDTKEELDAVEKDLVEVEGNLQRLSWFRFVPVARGYFKDGERVLSASFRAVAVGKKTIEAVAPVANRLGFKTSEDQEIVHLSMDEKIANAIEVMPTLADNLENIESDLLVIQEEVAGINANRYPRFIFVEGHSVQDLIKTTQTHTNQLDELYPKIQGTLRILPSVFGSPTPKRYAVIFQNDKELRPTGGFWTAYALVTMNQGKMTDLDSGDMYFVDYRIADKTPAPAVYKRFLKVDHWFIRDANLSPDYKVASQKFLDFWNQAQRGSSAEAIRLNREVGVLPDVDGVIAVDTEMVAGFLGVLGEITVNGNVYDHDNVILELEKEATVVRREQPGRKALIGQLMDAMFDKVFLMPENEWDDMIVSIIQQADRKHLLVYFEDERLQEWAENINWAGHVKDYEGDYLQVNEANFGGAKANLFVTRKVTQEVEKEDGRWLKTVTIDFENPEPADGWLNAPYRSYIRLLVPQGAELISVEGGKEEVPQESFVDEELGKQVFAAFNITEPEGSSRLVFEYYLPQGMLSQDNYRILIQKQPGKEAPEYELTVGKKTESFLLSTDKELEFD